MSALAEEAGGEQPHASPFADRVAWCAQITRNLNWTPVTGTVSALYYILLYLFYLLSAVVFLYSLHTSLVQVQVLSIRAVDTPGNAVSECLSRSAATLSCINLCKLSRMLSLSLSCSLSLSLTHTFTSSRSLCSSCSAFLIRTNRQISTFAIFFQSVNRNLYHSLLLLITAEIYDFVCKQYNYYKPRITKNEHWAW